MAGTHDSTILNDTIDALEAICRATPVAHALCEAGYVEPGDGDEREVPAALAEERAWREWARRVVHELTSDLDDARRGGRGALDPATLRAACRQRAREARATLATLRIEAASDWLRGS